MRKRLKTLMKPNRPTRFFIPCKDLGKLCQPPLHDLRCRAKMNFVEVPSVGRLGQTEKNRLRRPWFLLEQGHEACHRLDRPRCSNGKKRFAALERPVDAIELIRLLAEPADTR